MTIKNINNLIYQDLEKIFKKLNLKLDLKLYSLVVDQEKKIKDITRIKKTLSENGGIDLEINQERLRDLNDIFYELNLSINQMSKSKEFQEIYKDDLLKKNIKDMELEKNDETKEESQSILVEKGVVEAERYSKNTLIYSSYFNTKLNKVNIKIKYIIVLRNVDLHAQHFFYEHSNFSFLRMVLDYYFSDYYVLNAAKNIEVVNDLLEKKYNEDGAQFNRRIARAFVGKIQDFLKKSDNWQVSNNNNENKDSKYYINNLFEIIEDISNRTYEREHPLGNILFISKKNLKNNEQVISYTFKFEEEDKIPLDNAKLIRKLLQLTNNESDLYLIADHEHVYGVGTINWNRLEDYLIFRVEFKGLSKYDLSLISVVEKDYSLGRMIKEDNKRLYRTEKNLEILFEVLLSLSFKSPVIGEEGFTQEKFEKIIELKFYEDDKDDYRNETNLLGRIVNKAREQSHGTMIVITDEITAKNEVRRLSKQSTLIKPEKIKPEFIKYLTSIDGAIYFDNLGTCYAIGVILDGEAEENLGDSGRGARFNSAIRYLHKLIKKKCVIAIISEDGTIDIIPELDDEEPIRILFQNFIDQINEQGNISEDDVLEFENKVNNYSHIDYHHYLKLANALYKKEKFKFSIKFCELGIQEAENHYIIPAHYRLLAKSYFYLIREKDLKISKDKKFNYNLKALNLLNLYIKDENEKDLEHNDYNIRGIVLNYHANNLKENEKKKVFHQKALYDYSKAIEMNEKDSAILYSNRASTYGELEQFKEMLEDYVMAELIAPKDEYLNNIQKIIDLYPELLEKCMIFYTSKKNKYISENLKQFIIENRDLQIKGNTDLEIRLNQYNI